MAVILWILMEIFCRCSGQHPEPSPFPSDSQYTMNINMPDVKPVVADSYFCTAKKLDPREAYIIKYEPDVNGRALHHMLLFGCKDILSQNHLYPNHWSCPHGDMCTRLTIMYGWAKNAPSMELPPDVGFLIGGNSSIQYIILQIHYAKPVAYGATDNSGLKLYLTTQRQKYITGIRLLLENTARIPPHTPRFHVDVNCKYDEPYAIHAFAYRVHTHRLGSVVTGYAYNTINNTWSLLARGNPQWPQAFYPMEKTVTITKNNILAARCTYNTSDVDYAVRIGSSANDEMCNLYVMYYTDSQNTMYGGPPQCTGLHFHRLMQSLPPGNDVTLPVNRELEQQAFGPVDQSQIAYNSESGPTLSVRPSVGLNTRNEVYSGKYPPGGQLDNEYMYKEVLGWPSGNLRLGQVAGVATDNDGNVAIFHRGDHVWNELTFDLYHNYLLEDEGPITVDTVLTLDSGTGLLINHWGSDLFYMPHGLYIHSDGSYWVTDVALHQVMKFLPSDLKKPSLVLGERFVNGNDRTHFCKPASVAIAKTGDVYIADGYCNSRIVRFSSDGKYLSQWGKEDNQFERAPPVGSFRIPHKITLLEDRDLACVADRENGRIQCFTMITGRFRFQIQREEFGGTLYSVAYAKEKGLLLAVCGEALHKDHVVRAFVFNATDQKLLNVFAPRQTFNRPHDIAVLPNADEAFVCEIGPNVVWRFIRAYHKSTKKVLGDPEGGPTNVHQSASMELLKMKPKVTADSGEDSSQFETSIIIMTLLALPICILVLITVILRMKKNGRFNQSRFRGWLGGYRTPGSKFDLGSLLQPRRGFDPLSAEGSDRETDSDVEEYSGSASKT